MIRTAIALAAAAAIAQHAGAQIQFNVKTDAGFSPFPSPTGMIHGVAAADFDNDGHTDILIPTGDGQPPRLYRNNGDATFTDVAAARGLTATNRDRLALFLDYDADHDLDILIASDNHFTLDIEPTTLRLYRQNPDGSFTDVTTQALLFLDIPFSHFNEHDPGTHLGSLAAADLDADGDVDIVGDFWNGRAFRFRNNADGTFTEMTDTAGIPAEYESGWANLILDANDDGLLDIFRATDFGPNRFWINNGNWSFTDLGQQLNVDEFANSMGAAACDFDSDGDLDIYVTNIHDPQEPPIKEQWAQQTNYLFSKRNCPDEGYDQIAEQTLTHLGDWGWGCTWADFDLDARPDLAETNGFAGHTFFLTDRSRLWRNTGSSPIVFEEIGLDCGFDDTSVGAALITLDADRDGDPDILQIHIAGPNSGARLYINDTLHANPASITIQPRRNDTDDHFSIGATVSVTAAGVTQMRLITCGTSMGGQEPFEALIGLNGAATIDRIEVKWPDGARRVLTDLPVPASPLVLTPDPALALCPGDLDDDADTDVFDFNIFATNFGAGPCATRAQGDLTGDGLVNVFDFNDLATAFGCNAAP